MKIFKVGEKEYGVKYTINSLIEMEQYLGKPFTTIFNNGAEVSLLALRTLAYFGMKSMNKELTHDQVGEILTDAIAEGQNFQEVLLIFTDEMSKSLGFKKVIGEQKN